MAPIPEKVKCEEMPKLDLSKLSAGMVAVTGSYDGLAGYAGSIAS